jgi:hypothetical protein
LTIQLQWLVDIGFIFMLQWHWSSSAPKWIMISKDCLPSPERGIICSVGSHARSVRGGERPASR